MTQSKKKTTSKSKDAPEDIITLIMQDHIPLKELIKVLKGEDAEYDEKKEAFEEFAPLLVAHSKPEEQSLYNKMKQDDDMKVEGLEGDVEHALADQLCEELKNESDEDVFMAKVKVLAELVEHHIKEEEEDMLPDYRKNSDQEERVELGMMYLQRKSDFEAEFAQEMPGAITGKKQDQTKAQHA